MLVHPKTDLDKVCALRTAMRPIFEKPVDLKGFKLLEDKHQGRVLVTRGLTQPGLYPTWQSIEETMQSQGKDYARFEGIIILGGIGLGYLAEAIASKLKSFATLAIWEPDLEWVRAACYLRDNTTLLMNPQVQLVLGDEKVLQHYIDLGYSQMALQVTTIVDTCLGNLYPERRHVLDNIVAPAIKAQEGNRSTLIAFGEKFFVNALKSLPALPGSHTVTALRGLTPKMPAVIIGAGPGLAKHQHVLTQIAPSQGEGLFTRAILFAADTAMSQLIDWGVTPHFTVSVDPQAETGLKYTDVTMPDETALLYHPGASADIPLNFAGPKFICPSMIPPLDQFHCLLPEDRVGNQIQCQVHLACDVAEMMGCSPIILVGIDLCYYDGHQGIYAKTPSYIVGHEDELREKGKPEQDVNGTQVYVTSQFDQYRDGFANRGTRMRLLNGNEQGVVIPGIANHPLSQIVNDEMGRYWVSWDSLLDPIISQHYPVTAEHILAKLRPLLKDWRFYQLVAKQILTRLESATVGNRDLVNRWTEKLCKRSATVMSLLLLEQYGHVMPKPIRRMRLPSLADRMMAETEWIQSQVYYSWLLDAATLAYEEGRKVERRLSPIPVFTEQGQVLNPMTA